jgi:hypothetical protein
VTLCDSETAYGLLIDASKMSGQPSLWCLWSFVNVMYWQLREMSDPEGPIQGAVMPDAKAEKPEMDLTIKQQIKGQLISFAASTATEFATRQTNDTGPDHVVGFHRSGMKNPDFNGRWNRMSYLNDGKPVYQKSGYYNAAYFTYFRLAQNNGLGGWVIDDVIAPTGSVYSSTENASIASCWLSVPTFTPDPTFRVTHVKDLKAYKGQAIQVSGSKESDENGVYLRQPPYDNIDDEPHYIYHAIGSSTRKHLFWDAHGSTWVVCPQCNQDEGTDALSKTKDLCGMWLTMPPKFRERSVETEWVYASGRLVDARAKANIEPEPEPESAEPEPEPEPELELQPELQPEDAPERIEDGFLCNQLKPWGDSNHEAMLFSNKTHTVTFLSQNPQKMQEAMHPNLVNHLAANRISVGEALDALNGRFTQILSALTNIERSEEEASQLLPDYQLTGDALLKMLAIYVRIRCGIPVILMGECGCGKTYLISFLCAWLGAPLENLDVHGGTTEDDIVGTFDKAVAHLESNCCHEVFVFLDEVNTCAHMGIITEAICSRSLNGRRLPAGVKVLAAVNPHRRRSVQDDSEGLVFNLGAEQEVDPMSSLVYRVHPVPLTLEGFVFDFGALTPKQENLYIHGMVRSMVDDADKTDREAITHLISAAQAFCRQTVGDPSAVSLRDVKRCLRLLKWFITLPPRAFAADRSTKAGSPTATNDKRRTVSSKRPLAVSATLALAHVYWYRHGKATDRYQFWDHMYWTLSSEMGRAVNSTCFASLIDANVDGWKTQQIPFAETVQTAQERFCSRIEVEHGIAMNDALSENLFVVIVCILNRIPVFLVGKPGSSKTLTLQILANNLNGEQSANKFWRRFPSVHIIQFQCSPLSTAAAITTQFQMACSFQANAENTICVLLLDEVGLAEHSPDMPLKALHAILVDPPVAVVGLSNWVLDPAKMNRAVLLMRPQPSEDDLVLTAQRIIGPVSQGDSTADGSSLARTMSAARRLTKWLSPLALAYHEVYTTQEGRDFVGMRDYYQLVKLLRKALAEEQGGELTPHLLMIALCRSFGGKAEMLEQILRTCFQRCFDMAEPAKLPNVRDLIENNITDESARHLMLLTRNGSALPLLFATGLVEPSTPVLFGSTYIDDQTELFLIKQINAVKDAMAEGTTIVLIETSNIYESLYDVLNQRYVTKTDKHGKQKRMLRLAIGTRSQLCPCAAGFRIIVIVGETKCYQSLDLPLLNRFEKQLFATYDLLGPKQRNAAHALQRWIEDVLRECGLPSFDAALACYDHKQTIPSLVLAASHLDDNCVPSETDLREDLARIAFPLAVLRSELLQDAVPSYAETQGDLVSVVETICLSSRRIGGENLLVLTRSPVGHLDPSALDPLQGECEVSTLSIVQLTSAGQVAEHVADFFEFEPVAEQACLVVQCDPLHSSPVAIGHAMHIVDSMRARRTSLASDDVKRHVVVVMHMPPAAGEDLEREFSVEFRHGWTPLTVDDLRLGSGALVKELISTSVHSMIISGAVDVHEALAGNYQAALASCLPPSLDSFDSLDSTDASIQQLHSYSSRIRLVQRMLEQPPFVDVLTKIVVQLLLQDATISTGISTVDGHAAAGLHRHVELVLSGHVSAGTLRQSLQFAISTLLTSTIAFALAELDVNFNLALYDDAKWVALSRCSAVIDVKALAARGGQARADTTVENLGTAGPLIARYPFSWRIVRILQNISAARTHVDGTDPVAELESLSNTILGHEVSAICSSADGSQLEFLHDYVCTQSSRFSEVDLDVQIRAHAAVLRATHTEAFRSPATLHATATNYGNAARLYRIHSILALPQVTATLADLLLSELEAIPPGAGTVDAQLAGVLLKHLWSVLREATATSWLYWVSLVSALAVDIQGLLTLDSSADLSRGWLGIQLIFIYLSEIAQDETWTTMQSQPQKLPISAKAVGKRKMDWLVFGELSIGSKRSCELWVGETVDIVEIDARTAKARDDGGEFVDPSAEEVSARRVVHQMKHPLRVRSQGYSITFALGTGKDSQQCTLQHKKRAQPAMAGWRDIGTAFGRFAVGHTGEWCISNIMSIISWTEKQVLKQANLHDNEPEPEPEPEVEQRQRTEWSLLPLIAVAENIDAGSIDCIRQLLTTMDHYAPSTDVVAHFLRRYIDEIVKAAGSRDGELANLLLAIVEGSVAESLTGLSKAVLKVLSNDISLRRTALHCLQTTEMQTIKRCATSSTLLLLMLEQEENRLSQASAKPTEAITQDSASAIAASPIAQKLASMVSSFEKEDVVGMFAALAGTNERVSRNDFSAAFAAFGHTILPSDLDNLVGDDGLDMAGIQTLVETLADVAELQGEMQMQAAAPAPLESLAIEPASNVSQLTKVEYVSAVAELKAAIRSYCAELVLQQPAAVSMQWHQAPLMVRDALLHAGPAMYALRCMYASGGLDSLANVFALPLEVAPWLPIDRSAAVPNPTLVDPFPFLHKELYAQFISLTRDAVMTDSANSFEAIDHTLGSYTGSDKQSLSRMCFLAAVFSVTVCDLAIDDANPPGLSHLREFVRRGAHYRREESTILDWFASGCPLGATSKLHMAEQRQICAHLAIRALGFPGSWLHCAMCTPDRLRSCLLPTMPDDEFQSLLQASGHVGWYKCPNGHPYSVGNCTWPMEETRCPVPGCGKKIGGSNHKAVAGVTRMDRDRMLADASKPGYFASATTGEHAEETNRALSKLTLRVVRLFLHCSLQIALKSRKSEDGTERSTAAHNAANLIRGVSVGTASEAVVEVSSVAVAQRIKEDWSALQTHTALGAAALTLSMHLVLKQSATQEGHLWCFPSTLGTISGRNDTEYHVQHGVGGVEAVLAPRRSSHGTLAEQLEQARMELAATGATRAVRTALGEQNWVALFEQDEVQQASDGDSEGASQLLDKCVWRYRTPVSYEHFQRWFAMRGDRAAFHPLLACFLKHEKRLPLVKYIADVLEWHSVLFDIFGSSRPLERAQAAELTNDQAVALLPAARQAYAQVVLDRYCVAFNACFVEVEFLYECQANPFVRELEGCGANDKTAKIVDLTGTKTGGEKAQMSGTTPVAFSLPSQVQGETDAQGLCTIRLLELLQTTHNELLTALVKSKNTPPPSESDIERVRTEQQELQQRVQRRTQGARHWARAPGIDAPAAAADPDPNDGEEEGGDQDGEEALEEGGDDHEGRDALPEVPPVSHLTDRRVVQRQLIRYDPHKDLLPLLSAFSVQSLAPGQGASLEYNLRRLQEALSAQLLGQGASPLAISIRHFHYHGEAHAVGLLGALAASIPQAALPVSVLDQIWSEVSTKHRLTRLLALLETVVRFVGSVGSSLAATAIAPTTRLEGFALEVLLIPAQQATEVFTPTLCSSVELGKHHAHLT